ncbi:MAG TPA: hypothetical protein VFA05_04485 [Gaiellaceae bacterium]|nr:hypothetical protein [Gaiellaceae bacterium]
MAATAAAEGTRLHRQHVTFVGDSVAASIMFEPTARAVLTRDDDVDFELAACRRLATPSCFVTGMTPPATALETLTRLGSAVGPVVVVDVGYNDYSSDYRAGMNRVLAELRRERVQRVIWLTLRERWHDYITINDEIRAEARPRSWVTVVDWNRYSRSHPEWFQPDGIHLEAAGADALAVFLHRTLARLGLAGVPPMARRATRRLRSATARLAIATERNRTPRRRRSRPAPASGSVAAGWTRLAAGSVLVGALGALWTSARLRGRARKRRRRRARRADGGSALHAD